MSSQSEIQKKVEELQMLESQLQSLLAQKQSFQIETNEIENALEEIKSAEGEEVYKIISGAMIRTTKEKVEEDLGEKKKMLDMKVDSIEKQEKIIAKDSQELRKDLADMSKETKK